MSTSHALRRSALYRGGGHVRPRHSRDIDSVLIVQRTTSSVAECRTVSVLIICEGSRKQSPCLLSESVPIPRLSKHHLGPTYSGLPLPDARMGRNNLKQTAVSINISINRICQYCAVFIQSDSFVSKSSVTIFGTIFATIYQIYFRIL